MTLGSLFFFFFLFLFFFNQSAFVVGGTVILLSLDFFFFPSPYFYIFPRIQERLCFLQGQTAVMDGGADSTSLGKAG